MIDNKTCWAIVVAAGKGERSGLSYNKAFYKINGESVLAKSVGALEKCGIFDGIAVVISAADKTAYDEIREEELIKKSVKRVAQGGATRQQSVFNGLKALPDDVDIVAIHDAARAFVPEKVVLETVKSAILSGSGVAATKVSDTIKVVDELDRAVSTPDRTSLRAVQTPQTFDMKQIVLAHERAVQDGFQATDDAALYEKYIAMSNLVVLDEGRLNRKLTTREDFRLIESKGESRVGYGFDAHRLVEGRKLVLCGVEIPFEKGLLGHSDADCAVHALMDALLSCAGEGDIGRMFPDDDPKYENIYSIELLKRVMEKLREKGITVVNADVTIVAQKPKLAGFMQDMRLCLAKAMSVDETRVNVKATTTERMGYEGRQEGISASAVALVRYI